MIIHGYWWQFVSKKMNPCSKTKITLIRVVRSWNWTHFCPFHTPKTKKSHFCRKKTSKNLHVSQKNHNFAAEYRVNRLHNRRKIVPAMFLWRALRRERRVFQFTTILISLITIRWWKRKYWKNVWLPQSTKGCREGRCLVDRILRSDACSSPVAVTGE